MRSTLTVYDIVPERNECQAGKLEVLNRKWQAYDGNTQQECEQKMNQSKCKTHDQQPENVHKEIKASRHPFPGHHLAAERKQRQRRQFQGLNPKRNSNNSDEQDNTTDDIEEEYQPASKKNPKKVTQRVQFTEICWKLRIAKQVVKVSLICGRIIHATGNRGIPAAEGNASQHKILSEA